MDSFVHALFVNYFPKSSVKNRLWKRSAFLSGIWGSWPKQFSLDLISVIHNEQLCNVNYSLHYQQWRLKKKTKLWVGGGNFGAPHCWVTEGKSKVLPQLPEELVSTRSFCRELLPQGSELPLFVPSVFCLPGGRSPETWPNKCVRYLFLCTAKILQVLPSMSF